MSVIDYWTLALNKHSGKWKFNSDQIFDNNVYNSLFLLYFLSFQRAKTKYIELISFGFFIKPEISTDW